MNPGDRLSLDVHLVSDLRAPIDFAVVDATANWAGGEQRWRFGGPIPADDVVKVGQIDLVVPDTLGELAIELSMSAHPHAATNRYTTAVTLPRPDPFLPPSTRPVHPTMSGIPGPADIAHRCSQTGSVAMSRVAVPVTRLTSGAG